MNKLVNSLQADMEALAAIDAIPKTTLRDFNAALVAPVDDFGPEDIRLLRFSLHLSQPVFAMHLHTTPSTIRKWEQGITRPTGPVLRLLTIIARRGLEALA